MRAVVTRVTRASVRVDDRLVGEIGQGYLVLLGVSRDDSDDDARWMAAKVSGLRVFTDPSGAMNCDLASVNGAVLLISQFTLHGDARKGRRPSFIDAAAEPLARPLYLRVGELLEREKHPVAYGEFGATMAVESINDGPVTILLDSKKLF